MTALKYSEPKDVQVAIEVLNHIAQKEFNNLMTEKTIRPPLLRVIMELEELLTRYDYEQKYKELSKSE
jgi:hypothetical protein